MFITNKSIKGQLSLKCTYERKLANGEILETSMNYSLGADNILDIDNFITNPISKTGIKRQFKLTECWFWFEFIKM